jgi:hypothetical protein
MLDEIRSDDRPVLAGLTPDHLHGSVLATTFFYGLTDHTLYTDPRLVPTIAKPSGSARR